tara:strand:- start:1066 stop:1485 length:420 start_codon:yes stop_codon:yes gene_type:complete
MLTNIKAKIFLLLIGAVWGSLILIMLPLLIVVFLYDKVRQDIDWLRSMLLAQDHLTNAILGGHYLTTISSLLGHLRELGSATGTAVANVVDWGFYVTISQENHCTVSMEKTDVYDWSSSRALLGASVYFGGIYLLVRTL